jgi:hypothetical protein
LSERVDEEITVTLIDISGRAVRSWFFNEQQKVIRFKWDLRDQNSNLLPNGVYFVQAKAGKLSAVQKLLLLK